jgi:hypothetical protein
MHKKGEHGNNMAESRDLEIISCTNISKIKSLGKYLFKTKRKWENKLGEVTTPPKGSWKPK